MISAPIVAAQATALALLLTSSSQAQPQKPFGSESRNFTVSSFDRIELDGHYEVLVTTGARASVSATGPTALLQRLRVEVDGNRLRIYGRNEPSGFERKIPGKVVVRVSVPALSAARIGGSGNMRVNRVAGRHFDGRVDGSGYLTLASLQVQSASFGMVGSGGISAPNGQTGSLSVQLAGSGSVDTRGVNARSAKAQVGGSGSVFARANGPVTVDLSGSGSVQFVGGAQCRIQKTGSGSVLCS